MKKLLTLSALLVSVVLAGCVNTTPTEETTEAVAPAVTSGPVVEPTPAEVTPTVTPAAETTGANASGSQTAPVAPTAEPTAPVAAQ